MTKRTYSDAISYETPSSLDLLRGPKVGVIELPDELPRSLYWGPEPKVDLSDHDDVQRMYQAVVRVGTSDEQERWLDHARLVAIWPHLVLPVRCVDVWEGKFSELTGLAASYRGN